MANLRSELMRELDAAGLMECHAARVYLKAALLLLLGVGAFVVFFATQSWWQRVPTFLVGVCLSTSFIMIGHDSGHGAVSRTRWINDLPGYFAFPILAGLSLTFWKHKHNVLHHGQPNIQGHDRDIAIYPLAFVDEQRSRRFGIARVVQSYQPLTFWLLTTLTVFAMRWDGLRFRLGEGRRQHGNRAERTLDTICLALHVVIWFVVPTQVFGVSWWHAALFYVAWTVTAGPLLGAIFAPAHMNQPIFREFSDNFVLQLNTTQNLRTIFPNGFLLMGLDHQIEHHLFQRMPHVNLKRAAKIVRAFCQRKGLPYHVEPWSAALWRMTCALRGMPWRAVVSQPPVVP